MRVSKVILLSVVLRGCGALSLRGNDEEREERKLVGSWYPVYTGNWATGYCTNAGTPNGVPSYTTELSCCNAAFPNQASGACYAQMPNPPTSEFLNML